MTRPEQAPVTKEDCQNYEGRWGLILTRMVCRARDMSPQERQTEIEEIERSLPGLSEATRDYANFALEIHRLPNEDLASLYESLAEVSPLWREKTPQK